MIVLLPNEQLLAWPNLRKRLDGISMLSLAQSDGAYVEVHLGQHGGHVRVLLQRLVKLQMTTQSTEGLE